METMELKRRCRFLWRKQYLVYKEFKAAYGSLDHDTRIEFHNLCVIEDAIKEITGGILSDADFEKWEAELYENP